MSAGESSSAFGTCDLHGRTLVDPGLQLDWRTRGISGSANMPPVKFSLDSIEHDIDIQDALYSCFE